VQISPHKPFANPIHPSVLRSKRGCVWDAWLLWDSGYIVEGVDAVWELSDLLLSLLTRKFEANIRNHDYPRRS
jgi:hypothetical protein